MRAAGLRHAVSRVKDVVDVAHGADAVEPLAQVVALRPQQRHVHGVRPVAGEVDLPFENVSSLCGATRLEYGTGKRRTYQLVVATMPQRLPSGPVHERKRPVSLAVRNMAGVPKALDPALHET